MPNRIDGGGNYRGPRRNAPWLERNDAPLPDASVTNNRRSFLRNALFIAAGLAFAGKTASNVRAAKKDELDTIKKVNERVNTPRNVEKLPKNSLIPEDERSGDEFMTGMTPINSPYPLIGGYDFSEAFDAGVGSFIENLDPGTKVSILIPAGSSEECTKLMDDKFPEIRFEIYELPTADDTFSFPQDMIFPTGQVDQDGRIIMISSSVDSPQFKQASNVQKIRKERRAALSGWSLRSFFVDDDIKEELDAGVGLFGDEFLSNDNPDKFATKYVPLKTVGGDMHITRLPNGGTGLIVGKNTLSEMVNILKMEANNNRVMTEEEWRDFDLMEPQEFADLMKKIRELYMEHFAVDEVIFVDEPYIRNHIRRKNKIQSSAMRGYAFFHSDMLVKTATDKDGRPVAFCTSCESGSEKENDYARRVGNQFAKLGYEVYSLPCGRVPAMNYSNAIMFKNAKGGKVVMLPQYGIPEDEEAEMVYARRGFEVRKIDMSYIGRMPLENQALTGSVHCKFVVMK